MAVRTVRNANVDTDLTTIALSGLDSTAGMVVQTATDTFTKRTLTAANGIGITDPTGAGGNPTFAINPAKVQQFVATYAALTALTTATGLIDNGIYCTYGRTAEEDGGFGFWRYDSGSSATANSGTILAIDGGGAGRFVRLYERGRIHAVWFGITQGSTGASAANTTAIAAAMAQCDTDGGGEVILPPTGTSYIAVTQLDNFYDNVLVRGAGRNENHDTGTITGGTLLKATSATTVLLHRSPSGIANRRRHSGGFVEFAVDSAGIATRHLLVTSRNVGSYVLTLFNCEGSEAVKFESLVTSTTLAEAADNQYFKELDLMIRLRDSAASLAATGVVFGGSSNANTSVIFSRINLMIFHGSGDAVDFYNADNITVDTLRSQSTSTGRGFICRGLRAGNATLSAAIQIRNLQNTNAGYVEGTDTSGVTDAASVRIDNLDVVNASPRPTGGTGAKIFCTDHRGLTTGALFGGIAVGSDVSGALAAQTAMATTQSLYVYNTSAAHQIMSDGTNVFVIRINSNQLNFANLAGGGSVNLPNSPQIGGAVVSVGANDSGGAGFKLLRLPN